MWVAAAAHADVVLQWTQVLPGAPAATVEITCANDRLAATLRSGPAQTPVRYIYRGDLGVLWTIQPLWRNYAQQDSVTEISERPDKNSRQIAAERILAHPPAERAQAEAEESARRELLDKVAILNFADSGKRERLNGVECAIWVATGTTVDSALAGNFTPRWRDEVWVAPWSVLGAQAKAKARAKTRDGIVEMSRTFDRWWQGTPVEGGVTAALRRLHEFGGCPVKMRHYLDGELAAEYVFTGASTRDESPDAYVVPPGFERLLH